MSRASAELRTEVSRALRDALPIASAYAPVAATFGLLATLNHIPAWIALMMSAWIFAGAAQFMMVSLAAAGAPLPILVTTMMVLNARHAVYGITLGPRLTDWRTRDKWIFAFGLTDEVFAVSAARANEWKPSPPYEWMLSGTAYTSWVAGTVSGILMGKAVPSALSNILEFALSLLFLALLILISSCVTDGIVAGLGGVLAVIFAWLHRESFGLVISPLAAAAVGLLINRLTTRRADA